MIPDPRSKEHRLTRSRWVALFALFCAYAALMSIATLLYSDSWYFERGAFIRGEWWRLLSGNFAHFNLSHFSLNILAFACVLIIGHPCITMWGWVLATVFIALCITSGIYFWHTSVDYYFGFSGVVHGLLTMAALAWIYKRHWIGWVICAFVLAKVILEWKSGTALTVDYLPDMRIITEAHLLGLLSGVISFILGRRWILRKSSA